MYVRYHRQRPLPRFFIVRERETQNWALLLCDACMHAHPFVVRGGNERTYICIYICSGNAGRLLLVTGARAFRRAVEERRAKAERNSNRRGQRLFSVSQRVLGQGEGERQAGKNAHTRPGL